MSSESREQAIREIAYSKWEHAGWPAGDGKEFWLDAEQQFDSQHSHDQIDESNTVQEIIEPPPLKMTKSGGNARKRAG